MFYSTCATLLVILVTSRLVKLVRGLKSVDYLPGPRCFFSPLSLGGAILPTGRFNPGLDWPWLWRSFVYKRYKSETISVVPFLSGSPSIYTSSLEVAKQVLSGTTHYIKAPDSTAALMLWGDNVISSDYEVYKRHRRIVGPAFTSSM
ncbi:hypothetical protein JB92DRAFT_1659845 [Gautieria morchelliformis]|nr:hypothetical protein JB92DRAFT_1659845 [Gautieria morchelliformis]